MEGLVKFFIGLFLVVLALTVLAYLLIIVTPLLVGCIGFLLVKTKTPLVNSSGPKLVPFTYVLIWAAAITAGLYFGSMYVGVQIAGQRLPHAQIAAHMNAFVADMVSDAVVFFIEVSLILLGTLRLGNSALARRNLYWASAACCGLAALLLTFSPLPPLADASAFASEMLSRVVATVAFPFAAAMTFAGGVEGVWAAVQRWFWSTGGNLFIIGAALSKLMFILMLVQWVRGWLGKSATAPMRELRLRLTREERQRFSLSIGLTVLIAVALAVVLKYGDFKENDFNELVVIPLFLVVGGAYAGLVWTLWKSRPEPRVGVAWLRSGFRFWRRW